MASCKECVHVEACNGILNGFDVDIEFFGEQVSGCKNFKDRSRFVELPCKAGDTVYFDNGHIQSARVLAIYIDAEGGMLDLEITAYSNNALGFKKFINKDYKFEDIGKHLFLKKEEAEQALKEREENA